MKKIIYFLTFTISLCFFSCEKKLKPRNCPYGVQHKPTSIAFVGFDSSELNLILLSSYEKGSDFVVKLREDSLVNPTFLKFNDTIISSEGSYSFDNGFFSIVNDLDYEVYLPATDRRYRISNINTYPYSHSSYVAEDGVCGKLSSVFYGYKNYELDGVLLDLPAFPGNAGERYMIHLTK